MESGVGYIVDYTDAVLKGRGIAFSQYKNLAVYCAVIVDVAVDTRSGIVTVERAWSANDAGLVINPDGKRESPPRWRLTQTP